MSDEIEGVFRQAELHLAGAKREIDRIVAAPNMPPAIVQAAEGAKPVVGFVRDLFGVLDRDRLAERGRQREIDQLGGACLRLSYTSGTALQLAAADEPSREWITRSVLEIEDAVDNVVRALSQLVGEILDDGGPDLMQRFAELASQSQASMLDRARVIARQAESAAVRAQRASEDASESRDAVSQAASSEADEDLSKTFATRAGQLESSAKRWREGTALLVVVVSGAGFVGHLRDADWELFLSLSPLAAAAAWAASIASGYARDARSAREWELRTKTFDRFVRDMEPNDRQQLRLDLGKLLYGRAPEPPLAETSPSLLDRVTPTRASAGG